MEFIDLEDEEPLLTFDSIEEFEDALNSLEIGMKTSKVTYEDDISLDALTTDGAIVTEALTATRTCYADTEVWLDWYGDITVIGELRQKVKVDVQWSDTYNKYLFTTNVYYHDIYPYDFHFAGWEYHNQYKDTGVIDNGRTLWAEAEGYCRLTASIENNNNNVIMFKP